MNTVIGGFLTFAIMTLTLGYATSGMIDLINKEDPIINKHILKDYYTLASGLSLDLKEGNQVFAILVTDYQDNIKMDPSYVRLIASIDASD